MSRDQPWRHPSGPAAPLGCFLGRSLHTGSENPIWTCLPQVLLHSKAGTDGRDHQNENGSGSFSLSQVVSRVKWMGHGAAARAALRVLSPPWRLKLINSRGGLEFPYLKGGPSFETPAGGMKRGLRRLRIISWWDLYRAVPLRRKPNSGKVIKREREGHSTMGE